MYEWLPLFFGSYWLMDRQAFGESVYLYTSNFTFLAMHIHKVYIPRSWQDITEVVGHMTLIEGYC